MELQSRLHDLARAGYAVLAVSYDPVDVLAGFADKHGIAYPLLSDEGSRVIRALGLYNEHLAEQAAHYGLQARDHQYGVPYPGVFVLDEEGVVAEKRFEQSYRVRPSGAALAEELAPAPAGSSLLAVRSSDATYRPYQQLALHVELNLPAGLHVYGRPIPEGYTPLEVEVEPLPGLVVGEPRLPTPRPFEVEGLDERFVVHEGRVRVVVPFYAEKTEGPLRLAVRVRYQACTDTLCHPPTDEPREVTLEPADLVRE